MKTLSHPIQEGGEKIEIQFPVSFFFVVLKAFFIILHFLASLLGRDHLEKVTPEVSLNIIWNPLTHQLKTASILGCLLFKVFRGLQIHLLMFFSKLISE